MNNRQIILKKVKVNNLKDVDLTLNQKELIVFTGVSGSGKSSMAFDTIYVEGQRRYIESLSHSSKHHLLDLKKPDIAEAEGLSPTIAIEQKTVSKNPRSTVGTITGIYDFLRVLFAKLGIPHCPVSKEVVAPQSREQILSLAAQKGAKLYILSPYAKNKKASFKEDFKELLKKGFTRVRIDENIFDLTDLKELDPNVSHNIDLVIDRVSGDDLSRLKEAIYQALDIGNGFFTSYNIETKEEKAFSELAYSFKSGLSYYPLEPQDFSFNHPSGMCEKCTGLGEIFEFDIAKIIDSEKSIEEDCCSIAPSFSTVLYGNIYKNLARLYKFSLSTPWKKLPQTAKDVFLYGTDQKWTKMLFVHPAKHTSWQEYVQWRGVLYEAHKRLIDAKSELYRKKMHELMIQMICPSCNGNKLKAYPLATEFQSKKIYEITSLTLQEAYHFFQNLHLDKRSLLIAKDLIKEILKRLKFLLEVGLNYLTLDRNAPSLSGGEAQRVKLASHIGSGLIGTTYVLDEPSIGLHPHDHYKLINTLKHLRDVGNTVIVVEHDKDTIAAADTIVDFGPLAGKFGGEIVAKGSLSEIMSSKNSLTGKYLRKELEIKIPLEKRSSNKQINLTKISHHNLKSVDLSIPLNIFVCITGVSGSGKSSLITQTLFPAIYNKLHASNLPCGKYESIEGLENIDKIISVDQSPIGKTIRSNPATYIKVLDDIRDLFASLPESKAKGYDKGCFSFNVKEGSCPYCKGIGKVKVDMDFMEDEWTLCQQCKGMRFDPEILAIKFKNYSINDILEMEVGSAIELFHAFPHIASKLNLLKEVGLGYLHLGQSSTTLSGGEAQRIKLAKELCKKATGKTLYLLDEPTTGLHFHDIQKLLNLLQSLVERGNSVVVIEHNMDFIKTSDYVVDIGPLSGDKGGKIIGFGPPEKIALINSPTGIALKNVFHEKKLKEEKSAKIISKNLNLKIENASTHNLKNLNIEIPLNQISVFTGPSGSGKTTLAFDTIFAEGQRRYLEALPLYTREFIKQLPKAEVEKVENLPPCIALEQKNHGANPRSTLGTITEIYDFLRVLYAHMGTAFCPESNEEIKTISKSYVASRALEFKKEKLCVLAPLKFLKSEDFNLLKERLNKAGFLRIRLNNKYYELDEEIPYNKNLKNEIFLVVDRLIVSEDSEKRLLEAVESASKIAGGEIVLALPSKDYYFNLSFACESTGKSYPPITPQSFSFNSESGMCLDCQGLGYSFGLNLSSDIFEYSISDFMQLLFTSDTKLIKNYFRSLKIDLNEPLKNLSKEEQDLILMGDQKIYTENNLKFSWRGISTLLSTLAKHSNHFIREMLIPLMQENTCPSCKGKRLNPLSRNVKIKGKSIIDFCSLDIKEAYNFSKSLTTEKKFLEETLSSIHKNLKFLIDIGLGYLSLDRSAPSLSGGELERVYLAKHLGSGLTNCLYILDEPTIGLHPYNCDLLIKALKNLKDLNNTLLIVEHEEAIIEEADKIFDFGPKAGKEGGEIIASGTLDEIKNDPRSITGLYLSGKKEIPMPEKRRTPKEFIEIKNASLHNLKNIEVKIPKNVITCISGVSGSGKSTLINYVLKPAALESIKQKKETIDLGFAKISNLSSIENVIVINQHFLGNSIRSDVSTYSEIMPLVRLFFSELPLAKAKGMKPRYFSYNHRKGMCPTCYGFGYKKIDLQFLPSVEVPCPSCHGYKLNSRSLEIKYKNKHIGEILDLTIEEALDFFAAFPKITKKLSTLIATGLQYLKLGQGITTLSGGERQRLKLSRELSKRSSSKTLYLLDEPTIGLHSSDIEKLLNIFHELSKKGSTLIIIEHNMDVLLNSDYIIDMGPYSGIEGGEILCFGTPEEVAKDKKSYTARYLRKKLSSLK